MPLISDDRACARFAEPATARGVLEKPAPPLTDRDVDKIVERKLRSNDFRVSRWSFDSLNETNGYLGYYYTLSVTVETGREEFHQLKFFAKTPPSSSSPQYSFLIDSNVFNKEIEVYEELVPRLGPGTAPKWVPDFYLGKSNAIIVFEDGKQSGYATPDKFLAFDEEQCVWIVRTLAAFHSRSLVLDEKLRRDTGRTVHDIYEHLLVEAGFRDDNPFCQKYLKAGIKGAVAMVDDLLQGLTDEEKRRLKEKIARWVMRLPKLVLPSAKFRNVICHRDIWANNIMFRRDPSAGRITGCYIIDYQFISYSPPAVDFLLSLYLNTDHATRTAHFASLLDLYCDTMSAELAAEGLKMEDCLSRAEFVRSCEDYTAMALTFSVTNLQIMLLGKDIVEKYFVGSVEELQYMMYGERRPEVVLEQCRSIQAYRTRMIEILEEVKENLPDVPADC